MILLARVHFWALFCAGVEGVQSVFESAVTDQVVNYQGLGTFS